MSRLSSILAGAFIVAYHAQLASAVEGPVNVPNSTHLLEAEALRVNQMFHDFIFIICGSLAAIVICWRVLIVSVKYVRLLSCLTNDKQLYFLRPYQKYASLKKHLLDAPVLSKRHNHEFMIGEKWSMGMVPTRLQSIVLLLYFGTNIVFCLSKIHWDQQYRVVAIEVRHRTGILAVVNMIPLFLMSTRNSPFIYWLDMSFQQFNLLHRWIGRVVIFETLIHTLAYVFSTAKIEGWNEVKRATTEDAMVTWGWLGTAAMVIMAFQSLACFRSVAYEVFKYLHIFLAIAAVVGTWYHLHLVDLPQLKLLIVSICIWAVERAWRLYRIGYRNIGNGGTKATLQALPGNAIRVTVDLARPWTFAPGQHAQLYFPKLGWSTSHPFSVAWSEVAENPDEARGLPTDEQDVLTLRKTRLSFVIRARMGLTYRLLKYTELAPEGRTTVNCLVEGPYGGLHLLHSYGTVMLIAGGIGITHQVPHVRDLVAGYANGTVATRKVLLVWVIQSPEHLEWIRPWMTEILAMEKRRDILRIMLFISRPRSTKEIHSPSATVQMFPGRPNLETLLQMEIDNQVGALAVSVCGSGQMSDDVRGLVRAKQNETNIEYIEEAFSW